MVRRLLLPVLGLALLVAGCGSGSGSGDDGATACKTVPSATVASAIRAAGGPAGALTATASDAHQLTNCRWERPGANVSVTIDSAAKAPLRYWHRIVEQDEFNHLDPERKPQLVFGVGDDGAYGGAGAYWVPASGQLIALHDQRIAIVSLALKDLPTPRERRVAARIAQAALGTAATHTTVRAPTTARIELLTPRDGSLVRTGHVRVRGAIAPPKGRVTVNGRHVQVHDGSFHLTVPVHPGLNRIAVAASGGRARPSTTVVEVRRGASPYRFATSFARRSPGRVPRLLGERLDSAKAILHALGRRARVIAIEDHPGPDDARIVCQTRPFSDRPMPRGDGAVIVIADRDAPGACRSEGS